MSDFEIKVGQLKFSHFTNGWVKRELDTVADSFQFQYADLRTDLRQEVPIRAGDECTISLRGETLLTGYFDDISTEYNADGIRLTAVGRSRTGDLVDSSALVKGGRWRNATLRTIVNDLCEPFSIDVSIDKMAGLEERFRRFAVEPGESVADTIHRICRLRAVWATCTVYGGLHITRSALGRTASVAIEYGKNIIQGSRFDSWAQRHDQYLLKGQAPSDEEMSGAAASQLSEYVFDDGVNRYRPLLLVSTGQDKKGDLKRRAQWERNRRAGSGERWLYRVDGFGYASANFVGSFKHKRREAFKLWEPNMMVKVADPRLDTADDLLVAAVSYRWSADGDDGGRTTDLTLTRKEAFSLQTYPRRKKRKVIPGDPIFGGQNFYSPSSIAAANAEKSDSKFAVGASPPSGYPVNDFDGEKPPKPRRTPFSPTHDTQPLWKRDEEK